MVKRAKKSKTELQQSKTKTPSEKKPKKLKMVVKDENTVKLDVGEEGVPELKRKTGFDDPYAACALLQISINTVSSKLTDNVELVAIQGNHHMAILEDLNPQDGFEGMLISQMTATYNQAMDCMYRTGLEGNRENSTIQESLINRSTKLMRLYNQQLEALDKHRRGGKQTVSVEHVTVNEGGQAVVGNVGGDDKK